MGVPSGTVTFLFTDIERSMRQWQAAPDPMRLGLERHDAKVRNAIDAYAADFRNSPGAIIEIPQLIDPVSCVI